MDEAELKQIFGRNFRELRKRNNLSQKDAAVRAGVEQSYISSIEAGKIGFSPESLAKYAAALDCLPHELLADPDAAMSEALAQRHDEAPSFVDAIAVLEAFRNAGPRRRAVALAVLTGNESHLAAFPELSAQGIEAMSKGSK
jgi:transcriptional regulator with XRE-family HTH domain